MNKNKIALNIIFKMKLTLFSKHFHIKFECAYWRFDGFITDDTLGIGPGYFIFAFSVLNTLDSITILRKKIEKII